MTSAYPSMDQYNDAVQHAGTAFIDPVLKGGKVATNGLGLPIALGGSFALTYMVTTSARKFAVRCFHKAANGLETRYPKISHTLNTIGMQYFVGFEYQIQGILVNGLKFPIVKMDWVEGDTLGLYLERANGDITTLTQLQKKFRELEQFLRDKSLAHGDLQTGNLVVNGGLKLVDYDGVYVPGLPTGQGTEVGHKHFQHPKRSALDFGPNMDRFSFITIDLSLRALIERPILFKRFSTGDNIIFTANDLADPYSSPLFAELGTLPAFTEDIQKFARICTAPVSGVPSFPDFVAGRNIPPEVAIRARPATGGATPYIGAYDVLDATNFDAVLRHVGDRIELVGQITDVSVRRSRYGRPYVFINFGHWKGRITKINIWSDGLKKIPMQFNEGLVGKWVSVIGLVDPPYTSARHKYTHLSITLTEANQMRVIDPAEARRRLAVKVTAAGSGQGNKAILDAIDNRTISERIKPGAAGQHPGAVRSASSARPSRRAGGVIDRVSSGASRNHPGSVGFGGTAPGSLNSAAARNAAVLAKIRQQPSTPTAAQPTPAARPVSAWARLRQWLLG